MSRAPQPGGLRPAQRASLPLLDRLMDADPATPERTPSPVEALETFRAAVRRDLEAMLNARRRRRPMPRLLTELPSSIAGFGVPDPTSGAYASPDLRAALVREIEATVRRFEPRLASVSVTLVGGDEEALGRALWMKVDGVLRADPVPEPITFETRLEPVSRDIVVREA